jgi:serine phosphatase RsbU (regulator of sigma subunit)
MKRFLVILIPIILLWVQSSRAQSRLLLPGMADDSTKTNRMLAMAEQLKTRYPDSAMIYAEDALRLSKEIGYKEGEGKALLTIGIVNNDLGNFSRAIDVLLESVRISREIKDKHTEGRAYNNLGNCYALQANYSKALEYYKLALIIAQEMNDRTAVAKTLNNMGNVYYYTESIKDSSDFSGTLDYYTRALEIQESMNDTDGIVTTLDNISLVYIEQKRYTEALAVLQRGLDLAQKAGNRTDILHCLSNLGHLYGKMEDRYRSIYYHNQAISLATEMRNAGMVMYSHEFLADQYAGLGNFSQAYYHQREYSRIKDTLLSAETSSRVAELQSRYENEKREKEFVLLKQKGELLEKESAINELKANRSRTIAWASGGGAVLLLVVALLIHNRYQIKAKANSQLEKQNKIIALKNKDITDSINYAKRLQRSVITTDAYLARHLREHFVLYKPKDIVSGDFYWAFSPADNEVIVATADCTGHGVPGAFMSVLGASLLNDIIAERKVLHPNLALNLLRDNLVKILNPQDSSEEMRDGMDIVLCRYNFEKLTLSAAAAHNPLWIARGSEMLELKADRFPVGKHSGGTKPFALKNIQLQKGDVIYTFTDGYADQFGGPQGKKFKYRNLQKLLLSIKDKPMNEQRNILDQRFEEWRGSHEQVDDVTVIGIRV